MVFLPIQNSVAVCRFFTDDDGVVQFNGHLNR